MRRNTSLSDGSVSATSPIIAARGASLASFDEAALRAVAEDTDLRAMMEPQPFDDLGRQHDSEGKPTILDRGAVFMRPTDCGTERRR